MRRVKADALRSARGAMPRAELAEYSGVFAGHIGKLERGEVERVTPDTLSRLVRALDVMGEEIAYPSELSPLEAWALEHDVGRSWALELAQHDRIEGAYQDDTGRWVMEKNARILPPNYKARQWWRERWDRWDRDRQRRRRARARNT